MKVPTSQSEAILKQAVGRLTDLPCQYTAELGEGEATLGEVIAWRPGTVVSLNCAARALVTIQVGGKPVAIGSVVIVEGKLAVRLESVLTFETTSTSTSVAATEAQELKAG